MRTISNKTQKPLSVPLPRGKTLHLGPGKTGQISSQAIEYPPLKKLVDAGEIAIADETSQGSSGAPGTQNRRASSRGYASGGVGRRSGDR